MTFKALVAGFGLLALSSTAYAGDAESCKTVRLSDVGWTDITAITALTSAILEPMGLWATSSSLLFQSPSHQ